SARCRASRACSASTACPPTWRDMSRTDGRRPIVVDGVTCYWGVEPDEHVEWICRVITPTGTIHFHDRCYRTDRFGWWETPMWTAVVTPKHVTRAVKLAGDRSGEVWLDEQEIDDVLHGTRRTIETE